LVLERHPIQGLIQSHHYFWQSSVTLQDTVLHPLHLQQYSLCTDSCNHQKDNLTLIAFAAVTGHIKSQTIISKCTLK